MRGQTIASALTVLTLFSATPAVSARHLAEEYAERVQREKQERLIETRNEARLRAQERRRAAEGRRIAEEQRRKAEAEFLGEDESAEENEPVRWEEERNEEQTQTEDFEEEAKFQEQEAQPVAEEKEQAFEREGRLDAEENGKVPGQESRPVVGIKPREAEPPPMEAVARENEPSSAASVRTADAAAKAPEEAKDTGEGLLAKYLRLARERMQGTTPTAPTPPMLHIAEPQPMKRLEAGTVHADGTLLFSDSPEYVKEPGILYSDVVKDDARVFYYHLNDTKKPYKVAVVLEAASEREAVVRVTRRAVAAPSENYLQVGKSLQEMFFSGAEEAETIVVAPKEGRLLLEAADKTVLRPGELVAGMADFSAAAPVRVSVLFYPPDKNPLRYISEAKQLPADEHHLRGTFIGMNRTFCLKSPYHPKKDGLACVVLADGEIDPYCEGVDATDGSIVKNYGNYGVVYRLEMPVKGKTRFLMSAMGGVYAGAVRADAGKDGARLISVPEGRLHFGESTNHPPFDASGVMTLLPSADLADLGIWKKKPQAFFEFSPPGASNLPIMLILAPPNTKLTGGQEKKSS